QQDAERAVPPLAGDPRYGAALLRDPMASGPRALPDRSSHPADEGAANGTPTGRPARTPLHLWDGPGDERVVRGWRGSPALPLHRRQPLRQGGDQAHVFAPESLRSIRLRARSRRDRLARPGRRRPRGLPAPRERGRSADHDSPRARPPAGIRPHRVSRALGRGGGGGGGGSAGPANRRVPRSDRSLRGSVGRLRVGVNLLPLRPAVMGGAGEYVRVLLTHLAAEAGAEYVV